MKAHHLMAIAVVLLATSVLAQTWPDVTAARNKVNNRWDTLCTNNAAAASLDQAVATATNVARIARTAYRVAARKAQRDHDVAVVEAHATYYSTVRPALSNVFYCANAQRVAKPAAWRNWREALDELRLRTDLYYQTCGQAGVEPQGTPDERWVWFGPYGREWSRCLFQQDE